MAQPSPEVTLQVDAAGKDVSEKATEKEECTDDGARAKTAEDSTIGDASHSVETSARRDTTTDAQPSAPSRPCLVPLGSTHGQSSLSTPAAPHPKRFSAVNINKKFLEKNTATGSSTTSSSTSSNMKVGSSAGK
jgi:serine/arginine repetitive matrix protein 2